MKNESGILIIVLIIIATIIILYFISKKPGSNPPPPSSSNSNNNNNNSNNGNTYKNTPPPQTKVAANSSFNIGDKIYAGEDNLNLYTGCDASKSDIWGTFNTGDYLGIFIEKQNLCIKLASDNYLFGYIKTGSAADTYVPFDAKIYTE